MAAVNAVPQIDVDNPPPVLERVFADQTRTGDAGIVGQEIEMVPSRFEPVAECLPFIDIPHVEFLDEPVSAGLSHEPQRLFPAGRIDVGNRDAPPSMSQFDGERSTEAARGTRHDSVFSVAHPNHLSSTFTAVTVKRQIPQIPISPSPSINRIRVPVNVG